MRAAWLMMQQSSPEDYVIATGKLHSVKDVCKIAFTTLGLNYKNYVVVKKEFIRKEEPVKLLGSVVKAKKILNWKPRVSFEEMIKKMTLYDLEVLKK